MAAIIHIAEAMVMSEAIIRNKIDREVTINRAVMAPGVVRIMMNTVLAITAEVLKAVHIIREAAIIAPTITTIMDIVHRGKMAQPITVAVMIITRKMLIIAGKVETTITGILLKAVTGRKAMTAITGLTVTPGRMMKTKPAGGGTKTLIGMMINY